MSDAFAAVDWLLRQEEPEARRVAVQQIVKVRGAESAALLVRALSDDDWRVRKEAAAIAAACEERTDVIAALVEALGERYNIGLRNAAVEALVAIGPDAVPAAVAALSRLDCDGRKLAVEILGGVPDMLGIQALARVLSADEDENVRVAAGEALGSAALAGAAARDLAIAALVASLLSSGTLSRLAALESLSRLGADLPWRVFEPYARDPVLRRYAIAAAAGSREPAALAALAEAMIDGSHTIARQAVLALAECVLAEPTAYEARPAVRAAAEGNSKAKERLKKMAAEDDDARVRGGALLVLGLIADADDVPLLVRSLADDEVAERAERAIRAFGPGALEPLLAAGMRQPTQVRAVILTLAAQLVGPDADPLRRAVREALDETAPDILCAAANALVVLGEAEDVERIARLVVHADVRLAGAAANALFGLTVRHTQAARALMMKLDPSTDEATIGCVILGAFGANHVTEQDFAFLQRSLAHGETRARRAAVEALAAIGGDPAKDAVAFALADEEREVQLAAIRALGRVGRPDPLIALVKGARDPTLVAAALRALGEADQEKAYRAARPLISSLDTAVACAAVEAIGALTGPRREDALFEALDHPDSEVVKVALSELGDPLDARTLARLGRCLDHTSWEVRRIAAELLGQDKTVGAQALLRARYEREKDPIVREALATAVSIRPPPSKSEGLKS